MSLEYVGLTFSPFLFSDVVGGVKFDDHFVILRRAIALINPIEGGGEGLGATCNAAVPAPLVLLAFIV